MKGSGKPNLSYVRWKEVQNTIHRQQHTAYPDNKTASTKIIIIIHLVDQNLVKRPKEGNKLQTMRQARICAPRVQVLGTEILLNRYHGPGFGITRQQSSKNQ